MNLLLKTVEVTIDVLIVAAIAGMGSSLIIPNVRPWIFTLFAAALLLMALGAFVATVAGARTASDPPETETHARD